MICEEEIVFILKRKSALNDRINALEERVSMLEELAQGKKEDEDSELSHTAQIMDEWLNGKDDSDE